MSINVQCPTCEKKLKAKDEFAGKRLKCPSCGQALAVPVPRRPSLPEATNPLPRKSPPTHRAALRASRSQAPQGKRVRWPWYAGGGAAALSLVAVVAFVIVAGKNGRPKSTDGTADQEAKSIDLNLREKGSVVTGNQSGATESGATESGATESGATESGATESGATKEEPKPLNYQGKWTGKANTGLHVRLIYFAKNEFPCRGDVVVQYRSGSVIGHDIIWEKKDEALTALMREGEKKVIAKVKPGPTLSGKVFLLIPEGGKTEIDFAAFTKQSELPVTGESLMKDVPPLLVEVTNLLRSIRDENSAKQAAPKIAVLAQRLEAIQVKVSTLPKPSPEEEKRLQKIYTEDVKLATDEMNNELNRVFAIIGVSAALAEPLREFRKLKTPVAAPGQEKAQEPWRRLLLEDKVFTPEQLKYLEKQGRASDVPGVIANFEQTRWTIHLNPLPKMPVLLDVVIKLYGKPDEVAPLELYDAKLARFEAEAHQWGPIALVTKKGQKEIVAFVANGGMFKKGLKKSAEE